MRLYKYLPPERVDVLQNQLICYSTAEQMNDPFEVATPTDREMTWDKLFHDCQSLGRLTFGGPEQRLPANTLDKYVLALIDFYAKNPSLYQLVLEGPELATQKIRQTLGFLCLSEVDDNLLMWSHYADSHRGFVLGFDATHLFFDIKDEPTERSCIQYVETRPSLAFRNIFDQDLRDKLTYTKSKQWDYEKEWRSIKQLKDADSTTEYQGQTYHLFKYPTEALKSVILGCRISAETREKVLNTLRALPLGDDFQCFEASVDAIHFRLNFTPIELHPEKHRASTEAL